MHISKILNLIFNYATNHSNDTYCEGKKVLAFKSVKSEIFKNTNLCGFVFLQHFLHIFTFTGLEHFQYSSV